jgi:hypothetical protein
MVHDNTQTKAILEHLLSGRELTSMQAIELYGATRLSGIIYHLRNKGYIINRRDKAVKTRYGRNTVIGVYWLEDPTGAITE